MNELFTLLKINDVLAISYGFDSVSLVYLIAISVLWICAGIYSSFYMKEKKHLKRFYAFYILTFVVMCAMALSSNLFTYYMNYELMTLLSAPLVMHDQTLEARMAGFKYLIYSFVGAYFVLFGFFVLSRFSNLSFAGGGSLDMGAVEGHEGLVLAAVFCMIIGFGVKAGSWPLHAWLPTAHPIAVSPASAVLSGVIVKAGVVGIIRVVFNLAGADFIKGTWVQDAWTILTLVTILLGSTLAYFEPVLKKRLAYSTISQVSYILYGLSMFDDTAYEGAMLQFEAHAFAKCALFLIAGVLIMVTGTKRVDEMKGIGRKYPLLLGAYTVCALSMIGIPPTGGFIGKWYLIEGALNSGRGFYDWFGPVILLVSALLTAGYLLPLSLRGFFPGADYECDEKKEKLPVSCILPIIILSVLCVLVGVVPGLFNGGGLR